MAEKLPKIILPFSLLDENLIFGKKYQNKKKTGATGLRFNALFRFNYSR